MWKQLLCTAILAHASFGVWAASGKADAYPSKPIRLIVGFPAGITALAGGEVEIGIGSIATAIPLVKAKRLHALALTGAKRTGALPEVPTVAESGFPGFNVANTFGILAPSGTPAAVVELLNAEIRNIVQMDDIRAKFAAQGLEAAGSTPDEFRAIMKAEMAQWARVIKDARIIAKLRAPRLGVRWCWLR